MNSPSPQERMEQLQRAIDEYPRQVQELADRAGAAAQMVTGQCADGQVVATVSGHGEVRDVWVSPAALRESDSRALASRIMEAVNDGLGRAEELVASAGGVAHDSQDEEALARFERRMDNLIYRLDHIDRKFDHLDD